MSQVINTNSLSLITQNNMNKSQSALGTAIERLSSGLRINSAKDDAAGQAIANRFTSNIQGLRQAARNANDGISIAQTTEGSLEEINNNLQRIRELTVQAKNGTNSSSDLASIQDEITSRLAEIDRVSAQTQFNGVNVLAKDGRMSVQVGANDGQTIDIDLQKIDSSTLGLEKFSIAGGETKSFNVDNLQAATEAVSVDKKIYQDKNGDYYTKATGGTHSGSYYKVELDKTTGAVTMQLNATAQASAPEGIHPVTDYPAEGAVTTTADPLAALDKAIAHIDKFRSSLGAIQNRLNSAVSNLNNTTTNLASAQSRIQDADYATEVSNMSRAQIVQQAGNSVLARANQVLQLVLALLQS